MEFLINPNVSYVLLILGFLTAILALFTPGTGILEAIALTALALAGYGMLNLPMNGWALALMVLGIIPFILALFLPRRFRVLLTTISAFVFLVGSTLLFRGNTWLPVVNPILILLLVPATLGMTWFLSAKLVESAASRPAFDLERLVGMTGEVSSDIRGRGTVYVNGEEWTAFSPTFIPAGCQVRVIRRNGLALDVEEVRATKDALPQARRIT